MRYAAYCSNSSVLTYQTNVISQRTVHCYDNDEMANVYLCVVKIWLGWEAARVNPCKFLLVLLGFASSWRLAGTTLRY